MTPTDPQPEPKSRKPKSKSADKAIQNVETSAAEGVTPKSRRKTPAEKEAERIARMKAEAEKPLDPKIWFALGAILLIVAGFIYIDPVTFAEAGNSGNDGMWVRDVLVLIVGILGHVPTVLVLAVIGLLSIGMGVWGWMDARKPKPEQKS
ncbi:MAG: hypothetical protein ABI690_32360 [Chloroflexota bacterium]